MNNISPFSSYSHVLSIKVWNQATNTTTDYANICNKIKSKFLEREKEQGWFKLTSTGPFCGGDLAIQLENISDINIVQMVCDLISDFNNVLHAEGTLSQHQRIIFQLVKPLLTSTISMSE